METNPLPATTLQHTYADDGSFTVNIEIEDEDGVYTYSHTVDVSNAAPSASIDALAPNPWREGDSISLTAQASDVPDDTLSYEWRVERDGAEYISPTSTVQPNFMFTTDDQGNYLVFLTVRDEDDGETTVMSPEIFVSNVAPSPSILNVPTETVDEGTLITVDSDVIDPGDDIIDYAWSVLRGGEPFPLPTNTDTEGASFSFVPTDDGNYSIVLTVSDGDGDQNTVTADVTVVNVAPTVGITGTPSTSHPEGTLIELVSQVSDPGSEDNLSYFWSVTRNGSPYPLPGGTVAYLSTFAFEPVDQGSYVVSLHVSDMDGGDVTVSTQPITVHNMAPEAGLLNVPTLPIDEGTLVTINSHASDVGDDTLSYAWSVLRDGISYPLATGTDTGESLSFTPNDQGTYQVSLTVSDGDTGQVTVTSAIDVVDVAPGVTIRGPNTRDEGQDGTWDFSDITDPGNDPITAWQISWGDGTTDSGVGTPGTFNHTYLDDGSYSVSIQVTDDDGKTYANLGQLPVDVDNVAPGLGVIENNVTVDEGQTATNSGTWSDAGLDDVLLTATEGHVTKNPDGTWDWSYFADDGPALFSTVTITANDQDAGVTTLDFALVVNNLVPTVQINGVPSGPIFEGTPIVLTPGVIDGPGDTHTYQWSVTRDGVSYVAVGDPGTESEEFTLRPDDDGDYIVTLTVTDDEGASSTVSTSGIGILNANPTAVLTPIGVLSEGQTITVVLDQAADPSSIDNADLRYVITLDESLRDDATYATASTLNSENFPFPDDLSVPVYARILDKEGGFSDYETTLIISPVDPRIILLADPHVFQRANYTIQLEDYEDPGDDTIVKTTIDWGMEEVTQLLSIRN